MDKVAISIITVTIPLVFIFIRSIYLYQKMNVIERKMLPQKSQFNISISTALFIVLFTFLCLLIIIYYETIVWHSKPTTIICSYFVVLIIYTIVLFVFTIDESKEVILKADSKDNTKYDGFILKNRLDDTHFSVLNPVDSGLKIVTFDALNDYTFIAEKKTKTRERIFHLPKK